jgi:type VI secretion system secreted protein Hcp
MATDIYLQIDGIKGESTDDKHKDWIEVLSYSQPAGASAPGGAEAEKTEVKSGEIVVTKKTDSASPILRRFCSSGKHISKVTLDVVHPGTESKTAEISDAVISKVSPAAAPHDKADTPTESVSLNYGKIQWTYTQQK